MIVKNNGITVHKCIQSPGEFVITKCASYHAGFNMGFNCAEAVNFALNNWIDYGKQCSYCKCSGDNVKIDIKNYIQNLNQNHKKTTNSLSSSNEALKSKEDSANIPTNGSAKSEKKTKGGISLVGKKRKREAPAERKIQSKPDKMKILKSSTKTLIKAGGDITAPRDVLIPIETEENSVDNWVCCDKCNKWRKIPKSKI
jgi:hypothetical protein